MPAAGLILGVIVLLFAALLFFKNGNGEPPPPNGNGEPPPSGNADRLFYYKDLNNRGGMWVALATEYWAQTDDSMNNEQLKAIYDSMFTGGIRQSLYNDFYNRGGVYIQAATEFMSLTNDSMSNSEIEAIYAQVMRKYYRQSLYKRLFWSTFNDVPNYIWRQAAEEFLSLTNENMSYDELTSIHNQMVHKWEVWTPSPTGEKIEIQLASIMTCLDQAWVFRSSNWLFYDPKDTAGSTLKEVKIGETLYLNVSAPCTLSYNGQVKQLQGTGWEQVIWGAF